MCANYLMILIMCFLEIALLKLWSVLNCVFKKNFIYEHLHHCQRSKVHPRKIWINDDFLKSKEQHPLLICLLAHFLKKIFFGELCVKIILGMLINLTLVLLINALSAPVWNNFITYLGRGEKDICHNLDQQQQIKD